MVIKAIFFDIDGTLVDMGTRLVPDSTVLALNTLREKGIKLFICSGRHPSFRSTLDKEVGFTFDGYIYANGQCITDENGKVLYQKMIDQNTKQEIYDYLTRNNHLTVVVEEENRVYTRKGTYSDFGEDNQFDDIDNLLKYNTYQVSVAGDESIDKDIEKNIKGIKSARWSYKFADFIPVDGGKDKGVYKVLEAFVIDPKETMAFGDGANDIPMFEAVNVSIAMGNGSQEVKDVAKYTTTKVSEDGIYNALKRFEVI